MLRKRSGWQLAIQAMEMGSWWWMVNRWNQYNNFFTRAASWRIIGIAHSGNNFRPPIIWNIRMNQYSPLSNVLLWTKKLKNAFNCSCHSFLWQLQLKALLKATFILLLPVLVSLSPFLQPFSRWTWVSRYQNVFILDFIEAKGDGGGGGDNCSYKTCKAPVKSSPPTNQCPVFYRPDALPVAQPSVKAYNIFYYIV